MASGSAGSRRVNVRGRITGAYARRVRNAMNRAIDRRYGF